ncbi:MAG: hypothetical protein ACFNM6_04985 [Prevotella sp.]
MKRVLTLVLSLIIFVGCNQSKHPLPVKPTDSKAVETDSMVAKEAVDYSQFQNQPEHLDTIIGDWEIHAQQFFDGKTIDYLDVKYANYPYRFQIKTTQVYAETSPERVFLDIEKILPQLAHYQLTN